MRIASLVNGYILVELAFLVGGNSHLYLLLSLLLLLFLMVVASFWVCKAAVPMTGFGLLKMSPLSEVWPCSREMPQ